MDDEAKQVIDGALRLNGYTGVVTFVLIDGRFFEPMFFNIFVYIFRNKFYNQSKSLEGAECKS